MTFFRTTSVFQHTTNRLAAGLALLAALLMAAAPVQAQNGDFFLADNDVTVLCPDANVGDTGTVNGTTYTKRDRAGLDALLDADGNNPDLATTCTSGIEDMSSALSRMIV